MKVKELFEEDYIISDKDVDKNGIFRINYSQHPINGHFSCIRAYGLKSLKNAPLIVNGNVVLSSCKKLTSLEGIGQESFQIVKGYLDISPSIQSNIVKRVEKW